jgi:hypothetical protein
MTPTVPDTNEILPLTGVMDDYEWKQHLKRCRCSFSDALSMQLPKAKPAEIV